MSAAETLAPPDDEALVAMLGVGEPFEAPQAEGFTPDIGVGAIHEYTYTRADGVVERASSVAEVIERCPVLGKMPLEMANVVLRLSVQGKAQMAEEVAKKAQAIEPQPVERQKPADTIRQHEKPVPTVPSTEKKINKPIVQSTPEVQAASAITVADKPIEAPVKTTRASATIQPAQHFEQTALDIAGEQTKPAPAAAAALADIAPQAFTSTRSETPERITQATSVHTAAETPPYAIRRQAAEQVTPERVEPPAADAHPVVRPAVLLHEPTVQLPPQAEEVPIERLTTTEFDHIVELTLPPPVIEPNGISFGLEDHLRAELPDPTVEEQEPVEVPADTLDAPVRALVDDVAETHLAQLVTGEVLEPEGSLYTVNQEPTETALASGETQPAAAAMLAEPRPVPSVVNEATLPAAAEVPQPTIDTWETVLAVEPEPAVVYETFAAVLQTVAELPALPIEREVTDEPRELAPETALATEPQPELPPAPPIVAEIAQRLSTLETPEKMAVEPIVLELVVALHDLQNVETQEMDAAVRGAKQEELEELCEELLEAIGITYDEAEIRHFIRIISSQAFQPSLITPQDITPFLEHISTREVKRQLSSFTSSLTDFELELEQLLGKLVLRYASGLLKQPDPDTVTI